MEFKKQLIHGHLIKRYKRFLADVLLDDGRTVTAHCTNSGSMKSCLEEAIRRGVEIYVVQARVSPEGIAFHRMLPFVSAQ